MEVGSATSLLPMLIWDSYFDIMRFRSGKQPTIDIIFNTLDGKKKLLLT